MQTISRFRRILFGWVLLCSATTAASASDISVMEAAALIESQHDVLVLDIREDWERRQGHIPGTMHLPMGLIPHHLKQLPRDRTIILTCRTGNRTGQLTRYLQQQGFDNVLNMAGGIVAWTQAGLEITPPEPATISMNPERTP